MSTVQNVPMVTGHVPGSGVQQHSAGGLFPFVVAVRQRGDLYTGEVLGPVRADPHPLSLVAPRAGEAYQAAAEVAEVAKRNYEASMPQEVNGATGARIGNPFCITQALHVQFECSPSVTAQAAACIDLPAIARKHGATTHIIKTNPITGNLWIEAWFEGEDRIPRAQDFCMSCARAELVKW